MRFMRKRSSKHFWAFGTLLPLSLLKSRNRLIGGRQKRTRLLIFPFSDILFPTITGFVRKRSSKYLGGFCLRTPNGIEHRTGHKKKKQKKSVKLWNEICAIFLAVAYLKAVLENPSLALALFFFGFFSSFHFWKKKAMFRFFSLDQTF